jgi:Kef-type K+ transport system membrane component KefB
MSEQNKRKLRLWRGLMLTGIALLICLAVIETFMPSSSPFGLWWVIKTSLWLSVLIIFIVAMSYYWTKPSEQKTNPSIPQK